MQLTAAYDAYFLDKDYTPSARRWYKSKLRYFIEWCEEHSVSNLEDISRPLVRRFIAHVRAAPNLRSGKAKSSNTQHGYARVVKAFLRWYVREGVISEEVVKWIEMPRREYKVIRAYTDDDFDKLFAIASVPNKLYPWLAERDKAVLAVLLDTGVRANELCDLTLDRVRLTADDAYLIVNGKGRKQREVGLGSQSRKLLYRYIHRFRPLSKPKDTEQHVFVSRAGKPLHPEGLDRLLYRLRDATGITGVRVSAHTFRNTFAMNYLKNGGDIYKLSLLLGHASVVETERYVRQLQAREAWGKVSVFDVAMRKRR